MLSVQSYRRNSISKVELWKNRPFSGELPVFGFRGFLVESSTAFMQKSPELHENVHIKSELPVLDVQRGPTQDFTKELSSRSHILGFPTYIYCVKYDVFCK